MVVKEEGLVLLGPLAHPVNETQAGLLWKIRFDAWLKMDAPNPKSSQSLFLELWAVI